MTQAKFLLLLFSSFIIMLSSCKKTVCNAKVNEHVLNIKFNKQEAILLENSQDMFFIVMDGVDEGRCADWLNDPSNTCNTLCGDAGISGYIEINFDTLFYFNYYMDGCRLEQISPRIDTRYNDIKILFERLDPYPENYDSIIVEDYVATFKIYQTVEICERK